MTSPEDARKEREREIWERLAELDAELKDLLKDFEEQGKRIDNLFKKQAVEEDDGK